MLHLYHAGPSVCSVKVRVGLAEKNIEWQSMPIKLDQGEQLNPEYLKLNPNGVVPTLVNNELVVIESSIILEYIDQLCKKTQLMPSDLNSQTLTKIWLFRCLDIHAAINTLSFATVMRNKILASKTPEQIEASIVKMPSMTAAIKRRNVIKFGLKSDYLTGDFSTLKRLFEDMHNALNATTWLMGNDYSLADVALIAYIDRLDRLGFSQLWLDAPQINRWLAQSKARASYATAVEAYISDTAKLQMRQEAYKAWPELEQQWQYFLANSTNH